MVVGNSCGWCSEVATLACGGCGEIHYCSREHQRQHWSTHKPNCRPYSEIQSDTSGRYLVAARDLPAGTLIIKESPIGIGPTATSELVCLGCHAPVLGKRFCKCPGCCWPLCSRDCATSSYHHEEECKILSKDTKKIGIPVRQGETPRYDLILILRCILLKTLLPAAWKRVLGMVSHAERRKNDNEPHHVAAVRYFTEVCKLDVNINMIHHVRGSIVTNAINTRAQSGVELRGLYPIASRLNHGCCPNVTLRSDSQHTIYVRSSIDIKKGELLLFCYLPPIDPIWERQRDLLNIYYFNCSCIRCSDPTELGTYLSSPRCSKCKNGYMAPVQECFSQWKCSICDSICDASVIMTELNLLKYSMEKRTQTPESILSLLKEVIEDYHNQSYAWITVAQMCLRALKKNNNILSLKLRRDLWESLIKTFDILEPGLTRRKGVSLLQLACTRAATAQKEYTTKDLDLDELKQQLTITLEHLMEAQIILQLEPPGSTEEHWLHEAKDEIEKVESLLDRCNHTIQ